MNIKLLAFGMVCLSLNLSLQAMSKEEIIYIEKNVPISQDERKLLATLKDHAQKFHADAEKLRAKNPESLTEADRNFLLSDKAIRRVEANFKAMLTEHRIRQLHSTPEEVPGHLVFEEDPQN